MAIEKAELRTSRASKAVRKPAVAAAAPSSTFAARPPATSVSRKQTAPAKARTTQEELLAQLRDPTLCDRSLIPGILSHLPTACPVKLLSSALATSALPAVKADNAGKVTSQQTHFAKLAVNAVLISLSDLLVAGWKPPVLAATLTPTTSRPAAASTRSTNGSTASAASSKTSASTSAAPSTTPSSNGPTPGGDTVKLLHVHLLIDAYSVAMSVLLVPGQAGGKGLELESVRLSLARRLVGLDMPEVAITELAAMRTSLLTAYESSSSDAFATLPVQKRCLQFPLAKTPLADAVQPVLLDAQALAAACALQLVTLEGLPDLIDTLRSSAGLLAWLKHVAASDSRSGVDRSAYGLERSIAKTLTRLGGEDPTTFLCSVPALDARALALEVLLQATELDICALWTRAARVVAAHMRAAAERARPAAFERVDTLLRKLSEQAGEARCKGAGWIKLCEVWMQLARRVEALPALDRIAAMLAGTSPTQASAQSESADVPSEADADIELSRVAAVLTQACVALDQAGKGTRPQVKPLTAATKQLNSLSELLSHASSTGRQRVQRSIDSLRRRALNALETTPTDADIRALVQAVAEVLASVLQTSLTAEIAAGSLSPTEILADAVQTMRLLANATLDPASPITHTATEDLLSKCDALCCINSIASLARAEHAYYIASSWGALATRLYLARVAGPAVRFLEAACKSAAHAEDLFRESDEEPGVASRKRTDMSTKRFDLLGAALRLAARPSDALEAQLKGIKSVRIERWNELAASVSAHGITATFTHPTHALLGTLLRSVHELAVFHLLIPQGPNNENSIFTHLRSAQVPDEAAGALLEHCNSSLETHAHRDEAPVAARETLESCIALYDAEQYPLRRARCMLRCIELRLLSGGLEMKEVQQLAGEAEGLLQATELRQDAALARFIPQYQATLHMLQILISQRRPGNTAAKDVSYHAREAAANLRLLIADKPDKPPEASSPVARKTKSSTAPLRIAARAPRQAARAPVTPPKAKAAVDMSSPPVAASAASTSATPPESAWDDVERITTLLSLAYEATVAFGHSLAGVQLLRVLRRLASGVAGSAPSPDAAALANASLARHYIALGRHSRAAVVLHSALSHTASLRPHVRFQLLLAAAEERCHAGALEDAVIRYGGAIEAAQEVEVQDSKASSWTRAWERACLSERHALAAEIYCLIKFREGDSTASIAAAVESVRCALRAANTIGRLAAPVKAPPDDAADAMRTDRSSSPITLEPAMAAERAAANATTSIMAPKTKAKPPPRLGSLPLAGLYWHSVRVVLSAYLRASRLYCIRGSARDAEAFATEGVNFALALPIPLASSRALVARAEIRLQLGQIEKGSADLAQGVQLLGGEAVPEACAVECLRGDMLGRQEESMEDALKAYEGGQKTLIALSQAFGEQDALYHSPAAKGSTVAVRLASATLLPEVFARLMRRQAILLHQLRRDTESKVVLAQIQKLDWIDEDGGTEDMLLRGRLALGRALQQLHAAQALSLSLVPEAALSFSLDTLSGSTIKGLKDSTAKSVLANLNAAEGSLRSALAPTARARAHACHVREVMVSLAVVQTLQAAISKGSAAKVASISAALMDASSAVTLEREMLDAIELKLRPSTASAGDATPDFLLFKAESLVNGGARKRSAATRAQALVEEDEHSGSDAEEQEADLVGDAMTQHWKNVKARQIARHVALVSSEVEPLDLPSNWTVVTLTISRERNSLLLSRRSGHRRGEHDLLFSLPLDRQRKRDGEEGEDDEWTMDSVLQNLKRIVNTSNTATHSAKDLQGLDARKAWWTHRRALDDALRILLQGIEQRWLGAFKSALLEPLPASADDIAALRAAFESIIERECFSSGGKRRTRIKLDTAVFECLASLPPSSTDEELEDLLHFLLDSLQLSGVPVAEDEVDFDQSVIDLRSALESFRSKLTAAAAVDAASTASVNTDHHIFLVLDKDTCAIPWESIPALRAKAVSRIPSAAFLQDRIELAKALQTAPASGLHSKADGNLYLGSKPKSFYLINPSGDLTRTQERFMPWLSEAKRGFTGISGREPIVDELTSALEKSDLVLYFGHGGAEQYARPARVRALKKCAVTMLWGCSSAMLRDQGDFDPVGTPQSYMLSSAALVGTLWDVTDRECDGIAEATLAMFFDEAQKSKRKVSLARAVAECRDKCKLKYLSGAVVCYGVPVYAG